MKTVMTLAALLLSITASAPAQVIAIDPEVQRAFGPLPKPGNLSDILQCAGTNEVFWTRTMRENPRDPEAQEAKRKAGWYAAVALWVFAVESQAVFSAISARGNLEYAEAVDIAKQCRKPPDSWRE